MGPDCGLVQLPASPSRPKTSANHFGCLSPNLLVSPLVIPVRLPYIVPYITSFKEFEFIYPIIMH